MGKARSSAVAATVQRQQTQYSLVQHDATRVRWIHDSIPPCYKIFSRDDHRCAAEYNDCIGGSDLQASKFKPLSGEPHQH